MVSQPGHKLIATKFAIANAPQAASGQLRRNTPITRMANRLDRRVRAELLAQAADADVDDIRAWIEVVAPDLRQQPFAADHLALVLQQVVEDAKLTVRQLHCGAVEPRLATSEIEGERSGLENPSILSSPAAPQLYVDSGDQLVERERLAQVVGGAESEATQLRGQVRACRDDHDGHVRAKAIQFVQDAQPVQTGQQ